MAWLRLPWSVGAPRPGLAPVPAHRSKLRYESWPEADREWRGRLLQWPQRQMLTQPGRTMQTVNFNCPFCGKLMAVGLNLLGRNVRCPHCKQVVQAPANAGP